MNENKPSDVLFVAGIMSCKYTKRTGEKIYL
jgi:hypothetical protein